ncbi:MAG: hypothetical protein KDK05_24435 [Candidatus Competibacteraceae bacterium]|nr:hypothetical protein [Candidatus Competibacteraceae bacterium]
MNEQSSPKSALISTKKYLSRDEYRDACRRAALAGISLTEYLRRAMTLFRANHTTPELEQAVERELKAHEHE